MLLLFIKRSKMVTDIYLPISLLQICGKILQRSFYSSMYNFFMESSFNSTNQSDLKTKDSCINQL